MALSVQIIGAFLGFVAHTAALQRIAEEILRDHEEKGLSKPNIVFIITDDQDATLDSVEYMPKLKELIAAEGLTFDHHRTVTPSCCPSRTTLLTGMSTHNHNITSPSHPYGHVKFQTEVGDKTLPIQMAKLGYTTHMTGKYMGGYGANNFEGVPAGWSDFRGYVDPFVYEFRNTAMRNEDGGLSWFPFIHQTEALACTAQDMLLNKARELAAAPGAYKPFFLYVAPVVPHDESSLDVGCQNSEGCFVLNPDIPTCVCTRPPSPLDRHATMFSDVKVPRTPDYNPEDDAAMSKGPLWLQNMILLNQSQMDRIDFTYQQRLRSLQGVDEMVSDIVTQLRSQSMLDNTYIIYTSDNGYHLGHWRMGPTKLTPYEHDIRVPFMVRGPGVLKNQRRSKLTGHEDMFGALMTIGGAEASAIPSWVDGLVPSFMKGARREFANFEMFAPYIHQETDWYPLPEGPWLQHGQILMDYAGLVVKNRNYHFKFILWCGNTAELYNLTADPYETDNLFVKIDDHPELITIAERLDALNYAMFTCQGDTCREPLQSFTKKWNGNSPPNFGRALKPGWDKVFERAPRLRFKTCVTGHYAANAAAVTGSVLDLDRQQQQMPQQMPSSSFEVGLRSEAASDGKGEQHGEDDDLPFEAWAGYADLTPEQIQAYEELQKVAAESTELGQRLLREASGVESTGYYFNMQMCQQVMALGKHYGAQLQAAML